MDGIKGQTPDLSTVLQVNADIAQGQLKRQLWIIALTKQAQAFGLWAPQKPGCPFVCIEPWNGIADPVGFAGDIAERELDHCLGAGESYLFEYSIKPENY